MHIELNASGTPGNVAQDLAKQLKEMRKGDGNEGTWPVLAAIRDYAAAKGKTLPADQPVAAKLTIVLEFAPIEDQRTAGVSGSSFADTLEIK